MKKRNKKKLLLKAIRELNDDVSRDLQVPPVPESEIRKVYTKIKGSKSKISNVLRDYRIHILNQRN